LFAYDSDFDNFAYHDKRAECETCLTEYYHFIEPWKPEIIKRPAIIPKSNIKAGIAVLPKGEPIRLSEVCGDCGTDDTKWFTGIRVFKSLAGEKMYGRQNFLYCPNCTPEELYQQDGLEKEYDEWFNKWQKIKYGS